MAGFGLLETLPGMLDNRRLKDETPASSPMHSQQPVKESAAAPDRMLWAGTLMDIGNIFAGNPSTGMGMQMYMNARNTLAHNKRQTEKDKRQAEQDALNRRYMEARINAMQQPAARQTIKGADGYQYYQDTGERVLPNVQRDPALDAGSAPSAVQEYEYYNTLSPEQQQQFLSIKRAQSPTIERLQQEQDIKTNARLKEQAATQMAAANEAVISADSMLSPVNRALSLLESGAASTGTTLDKFMPQFMQNPDNQELIGLINQDVLNQAQKISGALSDGDLALLKDSTLSMNNAPETNVKILKRAKQLIEKGRQEATRRYQHFYEGGTYIDYRPSWMDNTAPAATEPAPTTTEPAQEPAPQGSARPTALLNKYGVK